MATILDQYGNPIRREVLQEPQTASLGSLTQRFPEHPVRGITPRRLAAILEDAERSDWRDQHELFADMEERDAHLFSEMSKRRRALLAVDWTVAPPRNPSAEEKKAAAYAEDVLRDLPDFEDLIFDALDAIGHGWACIELEWQQLGKEWLPKAFHHRPHSWFQANPDNLDEIRLRDNTPTGQALQAFGWLVHRHRAKSGYLARTGLYRVLAWPFIFKHYAIRDLAEFLEIYGLPLRLGKYPGGSTDTEKMTLLRAVAEIGHNAAGIIPQGMEIEFQAAAQGSEEPHMAMADYMDRATSKAVLGGTLTSQADGKSSTNALGTVHNEVRHDLMVSDGRQLGLVDLIYPILALNGKVTDPRRCPRLKFELEEPEDLKALADAVPPLVAVGVQIPVGWVNERAGIPLPAEGEAVLAVKAAPTPPAPNAAATAALSANIPVEPTDPADVLLPGLLDVASDPLAKILGDVRAKIAAASSMQALRDDLVASYGSLDAKQLGEVLALAFAAAALAGLQEVDEESA